jgi:hypothetical protein
VSQTQIACVHVSPEIFRENHFSVLLAVLDEILPTSDQVWEKKIRLKTFDKIVDTVTLMNYGVDFNLVEG